MQENISLQYAYISKDDHSLKVHLHMELCKHTQARKYTGKLWIGQKKWRFCHIWESNTH